MTQPVPKTLLEFQEDFATEEQCEDYLASWRWPKGFECPKCSVRGAWRLKRRRLFQCKGCRRQVSVTAGTAMHRSKLPLRVWFWAIFLVARHKKSISALQLQADLGLGSYETAWLLLHKIRSCFDESGDYPLKGVVEVDETLVATLPKGTYPGRGAAGRRFVVGAVEVRAGRLGDARMQVVKDVKAATLAPFVEKHIDKRRSIIRTDGWQAYDRLERDGWNRERLVSKGPQGAKFKPVIPGISLIFGNLKTWLRGQFHGVSDKYLPSYVAEFTYRYNRRRDPPELFGWVMRRLTQRPPQTLKSIRWAVEPSG